MLDYKNSKESLVNKTASEIDNLKVEKEKELKVALQNLHEVEIKELQVSKEIIQLQLIKKDLQIALSKAKHNARTLMLDVKILISEFFQAKDGR